MAPLDVVSLDLHEAKGFRTGAYRRCGGKIDWFRCGLDPVLDGIASQHRLKPITMASIKTSIDFSSSLFILAVAGSIT